MFSVFVCLLFALLVNTGDSKEWVIVRGKVKFTVESVETKCDHNYVEYFNKVPNQEELHTFRVVKAVPKFTVNTILRTIKSQHILYNLKDMDGCHFLNNPFLSKPLYGLYRAILVNSTIFKCPISPKVYYLKNISKALLAPPVHPVGYYEAIAQMRLADNPASYAMEIVWKYHVVQIK